MTTSKGGVPAGHPPPEGPRTSAEPRGWAGGHRWVGCPASAGHLVHWPILRRTPCSNSCFAASAWPFTSFSGDRRQQQEPPQRPRAPSREPLAWAPRGSSGKSLQAQGNTPRAPRVGLCGRLAVGQTYQKPPGVPPSWGSRSRGRTSWEGLLLGRLGGVFGALCAPLPPADGALGNSEGENGCAARQARPSPGCAARTVGLTAPDPVTRELFCPVTRAVGRPRRTIVTWLILPVVICLSQRLSHACLSISNYTAKLRMAH